ncbi:hypothetical protein DPMN_168569 [Dreissena polymorpha]|uniref:Uncharacterized protein n=1 Tax=Dreissena polymorpha TaxID=45954 RepID=A0A9D4F0S2_DREPO|nr:hypothetical protein DPMN_168497 [Dreissena polymorpha]KAH3790370.1 hypothetical protein DPMN_168569 [Dreissena polymorpha]
MRPLSFLSAQQLGEYGYKEDLHFVQLLWLNPDLILARGWREAGTNLTAPC